MEDSSSSSSYSFSDSSIDADNNSCVMCTKITYNQQNTTPEVTPNSTPEHNGYHLKLDRSQSDPAIRISDQEELKEHAGLEPNCDLFGIQLEVYVFVLNCYRKNWKVIIVL